VSDTARQLSILDQIRADEVALAERLEREADVSTLQTRGEAEVKIQPSAAKLRERVYRTIAEYGPITDERGSEASGIAPNTWRPRRLELEKAGRIVAAGASRTRSGRRAVAWTLAPGA